MRGALERDHPRTVGAAPVRRPKASAMKAAVTASIAELETLDPQELVEKRMEKFLGMGVFSDGGGASR